MDNSQKLLQQIESTVDSIIQNKNKQIDSLQQKNKNINKKLYKILKKLKDNNNIEQFNNQKIYTLQNINILHDNKKILFDKINIMKN